MTVNSYCDYILPGVSVCLVAGAPLAQPTLLLGLKTITSLMTASLPANLQSPAACCPESDFIRIALSLVCLGISLGGFLEPVFQFPDSVFLFS